MEGGGFGGVPPSGGEGTRWLMLAIIIFIYLISNI